MITLDTITYKTDGNTSFACMDASFDGRKKSYCISVDAEIFARCNTDSADAFLPLIILEAVELESDVIVKNNVSNDLLFSLNDFILPVMATAFNKRCIKVFISSAEFSENSDNDKAVKNSCIDHETDCYMVSNFITKEKQLIERICFEKLNLSSDAKTLAVTVVSELQQNLFTDNTTAERLMKIFSAGLFLGDIAKYITIHVSEQCGHFKYLSDNILDYFTMFAKTFSTHDTEFMIDCRSGNVLGNRKKIIIGRPNKYYHNGKVRLSTMVSLLGKEKELYFEVEPELEEFLINDRIDAFVVMLLAYALRNALDIESSEPVSFELFHKLKNHFIPTVSLRMNTYSPISLYVPLTDARINSRESNCGTGFSGGVDSTYTLVKNYYRNDNYKISHLAIFNAGVFECNNPNEVFEQAMENARVFARNLGISVEGVTSNIDDIIRTPYHNEATFRLMACAMSVGKLWQNYIVSSSKSLGYLGFCESYADSFELLQALCFSTHYTVFHTCGEDRMRHEKIEYIAESDPAFCDHLHPCVHNPIFGSKNCGSCPKCYRMMYTLDKLGKLERFSKAFPKAYYEKHRNEIEAKVFSSAQANSFDEELLENLVSGNADEETVRRVKALSAVKKLILSNRQSFIDRGKVNGIITEKYIYKSQNDQ